MKRVVITGATGMIGSTLARLCVQAGYDVVALARTSSARIGNLKGMRGVRIVDFDVANLQAVSARDIAPTDIFFHLAWVGTSPSTRGLLQSQVDNVSHTLEAVQLAARLGCSVFVGTGSQAEYGRVEGDLRPDTPPFPETGYGVAKLCAGQMSRLACGDLGIRHEWARILSVYGPRDVSHSMVMSVIRDAVSGVSPRCTKGEQLWDYLYCDDCARALLAMAERGRDGAVYPVGSGVQRPLKEYILDICQAAGTGVTPDFGAIAYQPKQVMRLRADISPLTSDTGFSPEIAFGEGVQRTIEWYKENQARG